MKRIGLVRIIALLMTLHFGGVSMYTYSCDSIVIETETDSDSETEDAKKEHKLTSSYENNTEAKLMEDESYVFFVHARWNMPHLEVASPPPDVS